jgi:sugar-specific transcriptional regulator TrmB
MNKNIEDYFVFYLSNKLSNEDIKHIRDNIIMTLNESFKDVKIIKSSIIKKCFELIDNKLFSNSIIKYIKTNNYDLEYKTSGKYKRVAGTFGARGNVLKFTFSKPILDNLFNNDVKFVEISGIKCSSLIETIVVLMEHEITHLILFLLRGHKDNIGTEKSGHTSTFKRFVRNVFNHTKITHSLNLGDIEKHHDENKKNAELLQVGDQVSCKSGTGILVKIGNGKGVVSLSDNKYRATYLKEINLVKKREIDVESDLLNKLKNKKAEVFNLNVGTKVLKVQIVSFNNKSVKLKSINDNKLINVYFWYLIGKF